MDEASRVVSEVRERMGYAALPSPMFIQGDPGPLPPPIGDEEAEVMKRIEQDARDEDGPEVGVEAPEVPPAAHGQALPPSPLIPVAYRAEPSNKIELEPRDLMVVGSEAIFKGNPVILEDTDYQQIVLVVLRAAKRKLDSEIEAAAGKRQVKPVRPAMAFAQPVEPAAPKKRRGRPKGSKNKSKAVVSVPVDPAAATE